jgi:23S rRNA (uracil1939-C5)-methyltransferase
VREVMLGVYRPGTHSVVPADACIVHHRDLQSVLRAVRAAVEALDVPIFDERTRSGALRYALARVSTARREVHLTLVSAVPDPPGLAELVRRLRRAEPRLDAMFLCVNPTAGNVLLSDDIRRLFGPAALVERFGRLWLESRPDAFLQANTAVATKVYETARRWLTPRAEDTVLDVYSGVGAIALMLAPHVARAVGIEASATAVECALANARRNGVRNTTFVTGAADAIGSIAAREGVGTPSIVVVNPPRSGLSGGTLSAVAGLAPERILYVSCDPRTLARDLAVLARAGYRAARVRAFDMLPQTPHVEAVALLSRTDDDRHS